MKQKKKERKKERNEEKKEINDRLLKGGIIRDIRTLSEQEEKDYYKPKRISNFWNNNLNMKVMVIKIEICH